MEEKTLQNALACLRGEATEQQQKQLAAWLDEGEENRKEYRSFCEMFFKLNFASQYTRIDQSLALLKVGGRIKNRKRLFSFALSGVAALVMLFFAISLFVRKSDLPAVETSVVQTIPSGEKKAVLTLANGEKVDLASGKAVLVDLGFATAVEDSVSGGLVYKFKDSAKNNQEYNTLRVPRGGEYIMTLSDGTRVWLNSDTELKYPVVFGTGNREVFISGEAFFDVAKDATHPFIVNTRLTKTIVRGTAFNVMAYRNENQTEITLVRGLVEVQAGKSSRQIIPGHQACIDNQSLKLTDREVNVAFFASWKDGLFDFEGMTLDELTVKLSRWYDVDFFFVNREAGEKKFTGAIKRSKDLDFMLNFIQKSSGVHFEMKGKTIYVYSK